METGSRSRAGGGLGMNTGLTKEQVSSCFDSVYNDKELEDVIKWTEAYRSVFNNHRDLSPLPNRTQSAEISR